jgi:hypothetical protein
LYKFLGKFFELLPIFMKSTKAELHRKFQPYFFNLS